MDLTLTPLSPQRSITFITRFNATVPPRKAARGRDQDRLVVYLLLAGMRSFQTGEYVQLAAGGVAFYETPGTLTAALRTSCESINKLLYDRNMSSPARQYALGLLTLAVIRESQSHCL